MTSLDPLEYRHDFPILNRKVNGKPMVYLDNTASAQTPKCVVETIEHIYYNAKANVHRGVHSLSQEATANMETARERVRKFINAESTDEVIFTRGTTEAINLVASSYGQLLEPGDEVILTVMEHHSNIVPWQLLQQRHGIVIKVVPCDERGVLDIDEYRRLFSPRTRVVSVCHVSNVLGTINPVAEIAAIAHEHGAVVCIDGAQAVSHLKVDVQEIGADFYAFSSHKMYGPTGIGILYGRRELLEKCLLIRRRRNDWSRKFQCTTWADLPFKFEAGRPTTSSSSPD